MSSIYTVTNTSGTLSFILVPNIINGPGTSKQISDVFMFGQGSVWGENANENLIKIVEDFACPEKQFGDHLPLYMGGTLGPNTDYDPTVHGTAPRDGVDLNDPTLGVNAPLNGQVWHNTTTNKKYFWNEGEQRWAPISAINVSTTSPSNPAEGELWFDPSTDNVYVYNETGSPAGWQNVAINYLPLVGDATRTGNTTFDGDIILNGDLLSTGMVNHTGNVTITGDTTLNGDLQADTATFDGDVVINATTTTITSDVGITGILTQVGNVDVTGDVLFQGSHDVTGDLLVGGTAEVTGITTLQSDVIVKNSSAINLNRQLDDATMLVLNGEGNAANAPYISMTSTGSIATDNALHVLIDSTNNSIGEFRVSKGTSLVDGSEVNLFTVTNDGTVKVGTANYEAQVVDDNDIPNKKYVDDQLASVGVQVFESGEYSTAAGVVRTLNHGLGGKPHIVQLCARCKSANNGYSVGEEVVLDPGTDDADEGSGVSRHANLLSSTSTQVSFAISLSGAGTSRKNALVGHRFVVTSPSWNIFVRAIRFS